MANINRGYQRFLAVGCSHGHLADPKALAAVLRVSADFKPHTRIHLGDYTDQAAFRGGAKGTPDECSSIKDDLTAGLNFLEQFDFTHLLNGNHEHRLWKLAGHHNEIVSRAASTVITEICDLARKKKAVHIDHYDINRSFLRFGDTVFAHGWMYNVQAIRDHAEHFGKCVIAHLHRVGQEPGRGVNRPTGYCVGFLGDLQKFGYAETRRATSQWSQGYAKGEYNDRDCKIWLRRLDDSTGGL